MSVVLFSKIDFEKIKIKKPISVGLGNYRLNIYYDLDPFLIQTPTLYNPFDISRFDSLDLFINSLDEDHGFVKIINHISSLAEKMADSYDLEYVNSIKYSDYSPDKRLRLNVSPTCSVFNKNRDKIDLSNLSGKTMAKYIITPKYIWMNYVSQKYGIYWEVVQVKVFEQNYDIYMFIDDPIPNPPPPPPSLPSQSRMMPDKYRKMIKMGIPRGAVENKMTLDGLNSNLYFQDKKSVVIRPDPKSLTNARKKLKKAVVLKPTKQLKKTQSISNTGFKPPSIEELNNIRLKLNRISK